MELLQENSRVSDECVHLEDVAGAGATGAANWPEWRFSKKITQRKERES